MKKFSILLILFTIFCIAYFTASNQVAEKSQPLKAQAESDRKAIKPLNLPAFEAEMPHTDTLDDYTVEIVELNHLDLTKRTSLVHQLKSRTLGKDDFQAFYSFLKTDPILDGPQLGWHSLKNELLVFLIDDGRYKETTAQVMLDIINNPDRHPVMREYTLQYIDDYFERHWLTRKTKEKEVTDLSTIDQELQDGFMKIMWQQLQAGEGPIAGTSLIRLNDLSKNFSVVDQNRLDEETQKMLSDYQAPVSSRMAALSVAADRKLHHLQDYISEQAFDSQNSISFRMAAIHAAVQLEPQKEFYDKLEAEIINDDSSHRVLKRSAQLTLEKFKNTRG